MSLLTKLCCLLNSLLPPPACLIQAPLIAADGWFSSSAALICSQRPNTTPADLPLASSRSHISWFAASGTPKQTQPLHFHKPGNSTVTARWWKLTLQAGGAALGASAGAFHCCCCWRRRRRSGHRGRCAAVVTKMLSPWSLSSYILFASFLCSRSFFRHQYKPYVQHPQ